MKPKRWLVAIFTREKGMPISRAYETEGDDERRAIFMATLQFVATGGVETFELMGIGVTEIPE